MDTTRIDRISKAFAQRRLSRRDTLAAGAAGLAATGLAATGMGRASNAQEATSVADATPDAGPAAGTHGPEMLFVQTYQSGTIAPVDGVEGRYTLTLEAGTGQTIYFSDRPDRIVGASPTPQFLAGLGFPEDDPPNAALVVETAPGETDVAVVELFKPLYAPDSQSVTYEIEVLANWQNELEMGFHEAPTDLAVLTPSFGAAQLFIDDCADGTMYCVRTKCMRSDDQFPQGDCGILAAIANDAHDGFCFSWDLFECVPCAPWYPWGHDALDYWSGICNSLNPNACQGDCRPYATSAMPWYPEFGVPSG